MTLCAYRLLLVFSPALLLTACTPNTVRQAAIPLNSAQIATARGEPAQKPMAPINPNGVAIEPVALFSGPMPTGVTVSKQGRIFLSFPRWGDPVESTVAELKDGQLLPFPTADIQKPDKDDAARSLISVQSVVIDAQDRLWLVDTGNINFGQNLPNGPKLLCINLASNQVERTIPIPPDVALDHSYLNDIRFDLKPRSDLPDNLGAAGFAYLTDSSTQGQNGIIVVDLASGKSWRKLHAHPSTLPTPNFVPTVEGQLLKTREPLKPEQPLAIGADGIALSPDGARLFWRPLASHHLYSIDTKLLTNPGTNEQDVANAVKDHGDLGFASDGLLFDAAGTLYLTDYENHAVRKGNPDQIRFDFLSNDPRLIWPDTLAIGPDQALYVTANQLNRQPRFQNGQDRRQSPYALFKLRVNAAPSTAGTR